MLSHTRPCRKDASCLCVLQAFGAPNPGCWCTAPGAAKNEAAVAAQQLRVLFGLVSLGKATYRQGTPAFFWGGGSFFPSASASGDSCYTEDLCQQGLSGLRIPYKDPTNGIFRALQGLKARPGEEGFKALRVFLFLGILAIKVPQFRRPY